MNEIQLGRYEYCMETSAVSPAYMYSSESVTCCPPSRCRSAVTTPSTARSNAPVRSSLADHERGALLRRPRRVESGVHPDRLGRRSRRRTRSSSPTVGPVPTNVAALQAQRVPGRRGRRTAGAQRGDSARGAVRRSCGRWSATRCGRPRRAGRSCSESVDEADEQVATTRTRWRTRPACGTHRPSSRASRRVASRSAAAISSSTAKVSRLTPTIRRMSYARHRRHVRAGPAAPAASRCRAPGTAGRAADRARTAPAR